MESEHATMLQTVTINLAGKEFPFQFRESSIGDKGVIRQIFLNHDYTIEHWVQGKSLIAYANRQTSPTLIIDAGANIGASPLYFSTLFPRSIVFSIEPDAANWQILCANTAQVGRIVNFHGAISDADGEVVVVDPGQSDWGFRTASTLATPVENAAVVPSICPRTILTHPALGKTVPLILKIDIEGAEDSLFRGDTSWMQVFPLIIIELHDWMLPFRGSSKNFLKAVAQFDFDLVQRGENIFLFNRELLA